jgi:hypothetical protein
MKPVRPEFGSGGIEVSLVGHQPHVHHRLSVKDWLRRLKWRGLWLIAQRSMRIWLADPSFTDSTAVALGGPDGRLVEEPSKGRTNSVDTIPSARRSFRR